MKMGVMWAGTMKSPCGYWFDPSSVLRTRTAFDRSFDSAEDMLMTGLASREGSQDAGVQGGI